MSDDLVERLRGNFPSIPAMRDAAQEIERLRAEMGEAIAERDALRARIASLEESTHYANGVADLAMKHRDVAEARIDGAPIAICDADEWFVDGSTSEHLAQLDGKRVALVVVND